MRTVLAALALVTLAACTQASAPPAPVAEAPALPALTGQFTAMSTTAMSLTGDMDVTPDVLSFGRGFRIEGGRIDTALTTTTPLGGENGTIAEIGVAGTQTVELRRVDMVRVAADAPDPQLCGAGNAVSHVILGQSAEVVSLFVFSGADAPGPNAQDSQLCGIFNYMTGEG